MLDPNLSQPLVDITSVKIETSLPQPQRMANYLHQIKNPYCYTDGGTVVKLTFSQTDVTLEQQLLSYLKRNL